MTLTWQTNRTNLAMIGDSRQTDYGCFHPMECYPWRLATTWPGTTIHRLGRSGAATTDFSPTGRWPETRAAIPKIGELQPGMVIIALGTIDYGYYSKPPATFLADLTSVVNRVRTASPASTLLLVHTMGFRIHTAADWEQYGRNTAQVARAAGNAGFLDLASIFPWYDGTLPNRFYYDNDAHPNCAMHLAMYSAINERLLMMAHGVEQFGWQAPAAA